MFRAFTSLDGIGKGLDKGYDLTTLTVTPLPPQDGARIKIISGYRATSLIRKRNPPRICVGP